MPVQFLARLPTQRLSLTSLLVPDRTLLEDRILDALKEIRGAYSLVFMGKSILIGVRDVYGFRPLWLGRAGDAYVLTSETCAFDVIEAEPIREVSPGEMVIITDTNKETGNHLCLGRRYPTCHNVSLSIFTSHVPGQCCIW